MTTDTPASRVLNARRRLLRAHSDLVAALKLIDAAPLPAVHRTAIEEAMTDNLTSSRYLADIARNLELTAPRPKP